MSGTTDFEIQLQHRPRDVDYRSDNQNMHILCLGDFSGKGGQIASRSNSELISRRIHLVDVDNFDQLISKISPHLSLQIGDQIGDSVELNFNELDDFHPDALYRRMKLFRSIGESHAKLAAQFGLEDRVGNSQSTTVTSEQETHAELLERVLGRGPTQTDAPRKSGEIAAGQLIESVVKPHIVQGADPSQQMSEDAGNETINAGMRALLHHPKFQSLEAVWRSLHRLVTGLETGDGLKLYLLDMTKQELIADLQGREGEPFESEFYRLLKAQAPDTPNGNAHWSCIACDFTFGATEEEVNALQKLSHIAANMGGPFLSDAAHELLGCRSVSDLADPQEWHPLDVQEERHWHTLRSNPDAAWLGLVLPRILLRLPYGKDSDEIDGFPFEEIPDSPQHDECLWGSGAYACAMLLGLSFQNGEGSMQPGDVMDINDLPAFVYTDKEGKQLMPCVEVVLNETAGEAILERGVMVIFGHRNRNFVRLAQFRSLAVPVTSIAGFWS